DGVEDGLSAALGAGDDERASGVTVGHAVVPGVAHGDVGELAGAVGAEVAAPLLAAREDLAPGLLVGERARGFPAVLGLDDDGRESGPAVAAVAERLDRREVAHAHALEHVE